MLAAVNRAQPAGIRQQIGLTQTGRRARDQPARQRRRRRARHVTRSAPQGPSVSATWSPAPTAGRRPPSGKIAFWWAGPAMLLRG